MQKSLNSKNVWSESTCRHRLLDHEDLHQQFNNKKLFKKNKYFKIFFVGCIYKMLDLIYAKTLHLYSSFIKFSIKQLKHHPGLTTSGSGIQ